MDDQRVRELVSALRTMRKWGFTVIQDLPGKQQPVSAQLQRARIVARNLLGQPEDAKNQAVDVVAEELLNVAAATDGLGQFGR